MKFAMFILHGDDTVTPEDEAAAPSLEEWTALAGPAYVQGVRLLDPPSGRTVARRGGELLVTAGPFAETQEWIAGFALLECDSLAEAVELAGRNPAASYGRVEVRPVHSSTLDG
jgi:hypothetical protein